MYKRKSDLARGKSGKWTCCYVGSDGKKKQRAGATAKAESLRMAQQWEAEAAAIRDGLVDPREVALKEAGARSVADHVADYQADLLARGDTAKHAQRTARAIVRLLAEAGAGSVASISPSSVRAALARMKSGRKTFEVEGDRWTLSPRTKNFHLAALKSFVAWLAGDGRIDALPAPLMALKPYGEKEGRRVVRRALTKEELSRLLDAAERGEPVEAGRCPRAEGFRRESRRWITGPERAALYRLAMGTGFRADELRTLTPERFHLEGDSPTITVLACYAKNGTEAVQPITRELAAWFRPFLEGKEPGKPVLQIPIRTAKMLRSDLAKADIEYRDKSGRVVDFHALRHSYISHLVAAGVNPKIVQTLARHSTITLTLDRYCHVEGDDVRKALEGEK